MKKKTICAMALCAALSVGGAPVPQLDAPVALAAEIDASIQYLPLTKRTRYFADGDQTGALLISHWTSVDFVGSSGSYNDITKALAA